MFHLVKGSAYLLVVLRDFLASCTPVLWPFLHILCLSLIYIYIYIWWWWCMSSSPISSCIVSFLSLYTCFLFIVCNLLFLFYTKMPWWVLFKCFRKTGCENLSYRELFSCKVFQEFVVRIDLCCNATSGLSWLFVLLWFCHDFPKGEVVKDILTNPLTKCTLLVIV